jgi:RNA recognition motif-containing protein
MSTGMHRFWKEILFRGLFVVGHNFTLDNFSMSESKERGERGRERERSDSRGKGDSSSRAPERAVSRERGEERQESTCSLLVRNLSYNIRADDIKHLCSKYGEIRDVYIPQVIFLKLIIIRLFIYFLFFEGLLLQKTTWICFC